jgi:3-hydroxyacyl-CoA dehydrogenase/enoyl-CoA hydratase/3-hydroxybutyryl-CoA epimerase
MSSITPSTKSGPFVLSVEDGIGWLTFDLPGEKVNKLSASVMAGLAQVLEELRIRTDLEGVVIRSGKEGMFIAGADLKEIAGIEKREDAIRAARLGHDVFGRIQKLSVPVVAAIDGVCLGGGTELALACHGRLGTDHPRFGMALPEVNLGIIPGWGGTTRLPRLIGLQQALDMILTGRSIDARKAERIGLLDRAVPHAELDKHAVELVRRLRRQERFRKKLHRRAQGVSGWLLEGNPVGRALVFHQARQRVMDRTQGHYPAPLKALAVIRRGWGMSIERALSLEAEALADLLTGRVSKNLVHLFFLSEKAKKDSGVEGEVGSLPKIRSAGLLGAGTMGGGMAWALSSSDIRVRLKDVRPEALASGLAAARRNYDRQRDRGRLTAWELDRKMTLVSPTLDWSGFGRVDVVLEAIVEDLAIKKKVLQELEPEISDSCLIGSNTSTLPITELQAALGLPERMAGFHFFNPVDRMPLIEVIRGEATSRETVAAFVALAKRLGKTPVVVADCPGFLVNRILGPYLNEAGHLLRETGDLEGIDRSLLEFGMPMGPLRLLDEVGVDIAEKAGKVLAAAYGDRATPAGVTDKLVASGRLGKKSGSGFYRHQGKKATPDPDALEVLAIARRGSVDPQEAVERCVYAMIAEAARCLDEEVVTGPGPLDLAMVMGAGFPPFRGGLLRYADSLGLKGVVEKLQILEVRLGPRFRPPEALIRKAQRGKGFYA